MKFLPYFYFLRIPLLIAVGLLIFPLIAIGPGHPPNALLGGMFELNWGGVLVCSLGALLLFGAIGTTTTLILLYGHERFFAAELPDGFRDTWRHIGRLPVPKVAKWFLVAYAAITSVFLFALIKGVAWDGWPARFAAVAGATVIFGFLVFGLSVLWASLYSGKLARSGKRFNEFLGRVFSRTPAGFLQPKPGPFQGNEWRFEEPPILRPGHRFAALMGAVTVVFYSLFALSRYWTRLEPISRGLAQGSIGLNTPALFAIITLMILFCWLLAAMSFTLDRYRVPVLAPLALWMLLSAQFPESDHYFDIKERDTISDLKPLDALTAVDNGGSAIVVATTGGGIQAAAWTARVLTGIAERAYQQSDDKGKKFTRLVRATSSVSGGSLGILYFADAYKDGEIDKARLPGINIAARAASLDDVAWGLLYPDFVRAFAVLLIPRRIDRGWAIEQAWRDHLTDRKSPTLDEWRRDAKAGKRPAAIFNTTLVETGERFLLPSVDIRKADGRRSLREIPGYESIDVPAVTATRLSASFPYVTPVARASCCPHPVGPTTLLTEATTTTTASAPWSTCCSRPPTGSPRAKTRNSSAFSSSRSRSTSPMKIVVRWAAKVGSSRLSRRSAPSWTFVALANIRTRKPRSEC